MRGTLAEHTCEFLRLRFIPAHAGNTWSDAHRDSRCRVHPRACGEHVVQGRWITSSSGSSPRMRGTLFEDQEEQTSKRFIPAHAGNTCNPQVNKCPQAVHPRACGEHFSTLFKRLDCLGSSPRMRGTRAFLVLPSNDTRFIPAHAGNT